jgi:hypothetical protein
MSKKKNRCKIIIFQYLSDKPAKKTTQYLFISSLLLIIVIAIPLITLLDLSNYKGTIDDTQLGFNADIIKSYFKLMSNEELSLFFIANVLDYVFLIAFGLFIFSSGLITTRKMKKNRIWQKVGYSASSLGILYIVFDGIENFFLIFMILDPVSFPNWLAILHSSLASVKFTVMYIAFIWLIVSVSILILFQIKRKFLNYLKW